MENPKELRFDSNNSVFQFFPIEIIIEILTRSPVKALGRFSTVSKSWYALIKSRMFINEHLKNYSISLANKPYSSEIHSGHVLLMPTILREHERYSCSLYCDNTFVQHGSFDIPLVKNWLELLSVANSCNGIICLADRKAFSGRKVCLYNPSIRKLKFISNSCFPDTIYGPRIVYSRLGFGFSEITNNFKVVRIHYIKDEDSRMLGKVPPEVEVYSLNADDWRRISTNVKYIVHDRSICYNGSIYWLARRMDESIFAAIMCFDIDREEFCEIELPVKWNSFTDGSLLVFKGLLALFKEGPFSDREVGGVKCYELWVMKGEYRGAESWTRSQIWRTDESVEKAFGFTRSRKLLMQMDGGWLATWDPKRNVLQHQNIDGILNHVDPAFLESLVLYDDRCVDSVDRNQVVQVFANF